MEYLPRWTSRVLIVSSTALFPATLAIADTNGDTPLSKRAWSIQIIEPEIDRSLRGPETYTLDYVLAIDEDGTILGNTLFFAETSFTYDDLTRSKVWLWKAGQANVISPDLETVITPRNFRDQYTPYSGPDITYFDESGSVQMSDLQHKWRYSQEDGLQPIEVLEGSQAKEAEQTTLNLSYGPTAGLTQPELISYGNTRVLKQLPDGRVFGGSWRRSEDIPSYRSIGGELSFWVDQVDEPGGVIDYIDFDQWPDLTEALAPDKVICIEDVLSNGDFIIKAIQSDPSLSDRYVCLSRSGTFITTLWSENFWHVTATDATPIKLAATQSFLATASPELEIVTRQRYLKHLVKPDSHLVIGQTSFHYANDLFSSPMMALLWHYDDRVTYPMGVLQTDGLFSTPPINNVLNSDYLHGIAGEASAPDSGGARVFWHYDPDSHQTRILNTIPTDQENTGPAIDNSVPLWVDSSGWILGYGEHSGFWLYNSRTDSSQSLEDKFPGGRYFTDHINYGIRVDALDGIDKNGVGFGQVELPPLEQYSYYKGFRYSGSKRKFKAIMLSPESGFIALDDLVGKDKLDELNLKTLRRVISHNRHYQVIVEAETLDGKTVNFIMEPATDTPSINEWSSMTLFQLLKWFFQSDLSFGEKLAIVFDWAMQRS